MTEDEGQLVLAVKNWYYHEHGKLIAAALAKVPEHLQRELTDQLAEMSIFSTSYELHLPAARATHDAEATVRALQLEMGGWDGGEWRVTA